MVLASRYLAYPPLFAEPMLDALTTPVNERERRVAANKSQI